MLRALYNGVRDTRTLIVIPTAPNLAHPKAKDRAGRLQVGLHPRLLHAVSPVYSVCVSTPPPRPPQRRGDGQVPSTPTMLLLRAAPSFQGGFTGRKRSTRGVGFPPLPKAGSRTRRCDSDKVGRC